MHKFAIRRDRNMNNEFKQKLQEREFPALKDKHRVILKWATGCGKSKMVIDLINHAVDSFRNKPVKILFLVAERAHIKNWEEEFSKWQLRRSEVSTDVACYASLKKYYLYDIYDIIVLDEAHHIFTEKRMEMLKEMENPMRTPADQRVYLLSATLSSGKQDMAEEIFGKFTTSTVTLKDAIRQDILPDPRVYVVGMELDNTLIHQEIKIGNDPNAPVIKWEDRNKYIYKNIPCIIRCTEFQKNLYLTTTMEYWKKRYDISHSEFQHNKWVNIGSQRKRFLGELKTGAVRKLIESFPRSKRYVCFCASVAQAESLSKTNTISSKRPAKLNQMIIDAFNEKKLNNIFAVGMITEGMNLTDIQVGIITQLDGKERLFIQKAGRVMRADDPIAFIFYYKGTQDEVYLKGALENIDEKYVQHININQLNNIKL